MKPKHIVILRHGPTEMSEASVFASATDVPLNDSGRAAAAAWHSVLECVAGFHSPLLRAAETARLAGLSSTALEELREWDLGELEGQSSEGYRTDHPGWSLFRDGAPGGESPDAASARADAVLALARSVPQDVVALVGHGQFSKVLATRLLGHPLDSALKFTWGPARAAVFSWRDSLGDYTLAGWNRSPKTQDDLLRGNS